VQLIDPGFRTENVLALRTDLPMPKYLNVAPRAQFYDRVLSAALELPGVSSAGYISHLPMDMTGGIWAVIVPGSPVYRSAENTGSLRFITPGFFQTMSIPFSAGRNINQLDTKDSQFVAVVSESFVRRYWPGQNAIGRQFNFALHDRTIVGVVGDIKVRGLERISEPQVYIPYQQVEDGEVIGYAPKQLVIRSTMDQGALVSALRTIIHQADPEQPISDIRTLEEIVTADTSARRTQVLTLASFAALAVILAGIGIHGLLSFSVTQRTQEIGVRMALGAQPADIMKMVLREGVLLAVAGVVLGAVVAYLAGRVMEALLAGLRPQDAATFLTAITVSVMMTILGSIFPALRAIHVDPATTIRVE
jgi:predicted permease